MGLAGKMFQEQEMLLSNRTSLHLDIVVMHYWDSWLFSEIAAFFFILTIFNPISANVHMFILFITYGIKDDEEQEVTVTTSSLIIFQ